MSKILKCGKEKINNIWMHKTHTYIVSEKYIGQGKAKREYVLRSMVGY